MKKLDNPAVINIVIDETDDGGHRVGFIMNKDAKELADEIHVGLTSFEPLISKLLMHLEAAETGDPIIVESTRTLENTLFNISIHFDNENMFFIDYSSSADDAMKSLYGEDYEREKEIFLMTVGAALDEFNKNLKKLKMNALLS